MVQSEVGTNNIISKAQRSFPQVKAQRKMRNLIFLISEAQRNFRNEFFDLVNAQPNFRNQYFTTQCKFRILYDFRQERVPINNLLEKVDIYQYYDHMEQN